MRERPILFSGPMVRALLDGTKTQTRRIAKLPHMNPLGVWEPFLFGGPDGGRTKAGNTIPARRTLGHSRTGDIVGCPLAEPGDQLWVREAWRCHAAFDDTKPSLLSRCDIGYVADGAAATHWGKTRPSMFMPRWASRITLEVTGVRVERLQAISDADAIAEGIGLNASAAGVPTTTPGETVPRTMYSAVWESINGPGSWNANPWVWVIEFRKAAS